MNRRFRFRRLLLLLPLSQVQLARGWRNGPPMHFGRLGDCLLGCLRGISKRSIKVKMLIEK
jgi:hypothetical protein